MNFKYLFIVALIAVIGLLSIDLYEYKVSNSPAESLESTDSTICGAGEGCEISDKRTKGYNVGNQMPNLKLTDFEGNSTNLYDLLKGKSRYVLSFAADWCSDCLRQDEKMAKYYEQLPEDYGFAVVFVDFDSSSGQHTTDKEQATTFVEEEDYPFEVFWDEENEINSKFGGILATPTNFLLDENSVIKAKSEEIDADILMLPNKEDIYDQSLLEEKSEE